MSILRTKRSLKDLRSIHLTDEEFSRARATILSFVTDHPAQYDEEDATNDQPRIGFWFLRPQFVLVTLLILLITISTSGAALAESTIPGDTLYPVKRYVTEPLRAALMIGPSQRSSWNIERVHRRLTEAEALARNEQLDEQILAQLTSDIGEYADDARRDIALLTSTAESVSIAAERTGELDATLAAHDHRTGEDQQDNSTQMRALADSILNEQIANDERSAALSSLSSVMADEAGEREKKISTNKALRELRTAREMTRSNTLTLPSTTQKELNDALDVSEALIQDSRTATDTDSGSFFDLIRDAHRTAREAELIVEQNDVRRERKGRTRDENASNENRTIPSAENHEDTSENDD